MDGFGTTWVVATAAAVLLGACSDSSGGGGNAGDAGSAQAGSAGSSGSGGGGGGSSGTPATQAPSLDDVIDLVADAYCGVVERCLPPSTIIQYLGPDCRARFGAMVEDGDFALLENAIAADRVAYEPDKVQPCLDELSSADCTSAALSFNRDACARVFVGTVDQGGPCNIDDECIDPGFCDRTGSCPGECAPLRTANESCEDDDQCAEQLRCDDDLGTCVSAGGKGLACGGGVAADCDLGLLCIGDDEDAGQTGLCQDYDDVFTAALGASCDFDTGTLCEDGLSCVVHFEGDMPVFSCVVPSASGAACNFGYPTPCPQDEYCGDVDPDDGDVEGMCTPLPGNGEPCVAVAAAPQCAPGLICDVDDLCHELSRLGRACVSDDGCASANCENGSCQMTESCAIP